VDADSGQGRLFREYLTGRHAVWAMAVAGVAALIFGASQQSWAIMLGGPAAVVAVVTAICWVAADRAAADRFYSRFADSVGLAWAPRAEVLTLTPLLGAGTRRHAENWMYGRLPGDLDGGVGHFVWERTQRDSEGDEVVRERNRFTICMAEVEASLPLFRGVFLRPRRGLIAPYSDWLGRAPTRTMEVESTEFGIRYELRRATDQDEILLRRLLSPSLVSWLAHHPLTPGFELKAGTLVVFVPRPLDDVGNLTYLIDATRYLAAKVMTEVDEELARVA
jgi:hypothetical protein